MTRNHRSCGKEESEEGDMNTKEVRAQRTGHQTGWREDRNSCNQN